MRKIYLAIGPVLAACALVAVTSCSTDEPQNEPGLAPSISPTVTGTSAYDIVKVPSITIDGNLNDWVNIAAISMADDPANGRGTLNNSAKVRLAWDDTYLYAAYDVTDTDIQADRTTRDDPNLYKDDEAELYIDPQADGAGASKMTQTDYHLLANIVNTVGDNRGTNPPGDQDPSFNASSFLAKALTNGTLDASANDVGYTLEMRIAWTDLGITPASGTFMRIDPAVGDRDGNPPPPNTAEFDWAGLTSFNNPSGWKEVQLVNRAPPTSAYDLIKVPAPLTVDGNLADWTGIASFDMADSSGRSGGADNTAKVKLAWDNSYLYAAYDVTDTDLRAIQTTRDNGEIYKDDAIELYLDPQGDSWTAPRMTQTDYQLLANIRDAVGDMTGSGAGGKDAGYNATSLLSHATLNGSLNATGTDVGYTLELRIAWTDLGVTPAAGSFMRIDPAVDDRDGDPPQDTEEFDWAGLASFNTPTAWKDVKLAVDATAPVAPTGMTLTVVSSSQIDVSWTASTSSDAAKYRIYRGDNGTTPVLFTTVSGSPYQDSPLTTGTTYTYQISTVDAAGNESTKTPAQSATTTGSCSVVTDNQPRSMPSLAKPGYLQSVTDPVFGTRITRITGDPGDPIPNAPGQVWQEVSVHNYSKDPAWNSDQSLILIRRVLQSNGSTIGWLFLDGSNYTVKYLRGHSGQARWHPSNPNVMVYLTNGGTIGNWNVPANSNTTIFTDTTDIVPGSAKLGSGEGNLSNDGRYVVEFANRRSTNDSVAFAVDLSTGQKFPDISIAASGLLITGASGWASMSASGNYVVLNGQKGTVKGCMSVYTKEGTLVKDIPCNYTYFTHADLTRDAAGDDIAVGQLRVGNTITTSSIRLRDGFTTTLGPSSSSHNSTRNLGRPGWVYVTQNGDTGPFPKEVYALKLDGSGSMERYAHQRSNNTDDGANDYNSEAHSVPSPDGKRVIFASNWGSSTKRPVHTFVVDIRQICP